MVAEPVVGQYLAAPLFPNALYGLGGYGQFKGWFR
jgi:hypothetical protein